MVIVVVQLLSHVWLFATPCPTLYDPMDYIPSGSPLRGILKARILQYSRILCSHSFLQRIFLTQGSNLGLLHWRQSLYHLSHREAPKGIYKKQLDLQSSPGEQLLLYSLAQVSLPGYSLFVFLNLSYFSKKNEREICTVSQAPGFWDCEKDNTCLFFPFHTQFPWFFSPYAQDLSQKPAPSPSGICELTVPLFLELFSKEISRILHGAEDICIHICHCLEDSQFVRGCYQNYFKEKKIIFLLPGIFFSEKWTLSQIELETHKTEKQSFPASSSIQ